MLHVSADLFTANFGYVFKRNLFETNNLFLRFSSKNLIIDKIVWTSIKINRDIDLFNFITQFEQVSHFKLLSIKTSESFLNGIPYLLNFNQNISKSTVGTRFLFKTKKNFFECFYTKGDIDNNNNILEIYLAFNIKEQFLLIII
ncbi:hypothetical protein BpHYR1_026517 [Brachionus plicatilis]|uniref:Uncharacterized protein n=1 Tax=Brachionus plicatilis TaxID=10195 RepID=A0A3M7QTN4_BRAPC|nr:hypothetical protein BpHYR1_026517 [Brachionus plicatilis]